MITVREYGLAVGLAIAAVVTGLVVGETGWCLFVASLIWILLQYQQFRGIRRWSNSPLRLPNNDAGSWFELAYRPYRVMQKERQRTRRVAARLREVLRLSEVLPDGIILLSQTGEIEEFNAASRRLLHLSPSDVGIHLSSIVRSAEFIEFLQQANYAEPLEFLSPHQTDTTLEARCVEIETGGVVVLVRDVTMLNRLLTMRQSFVANVSHELRTPLTVVGGYLETMADPQQPDALKLELIQRLTRPVQRMQSLVSDLLSLVQLESSVVVDKQPVDMTAVIERAVSELTGITAHPDQIIVHCEAQGTILGVYDELYSVCINLISNALRYGASGADVEVDWTATDTSYTLAVRDHGPGIAPQHISRLTERFYRVDMAQSRASGGTGLGLAIVKHILRRHDSQLAIKSELGRGSTFACSFQIGATMPHGTAHD